MARARLLSLLLASSSLTAFAGDAAAADLPVRAPTKAPVAVAIAPSWTGCYVGGHVGGGWGQNDVSNPQGRFMDNRPLFPFGADVDGFLGGVQAGCDYQFNPNWVLGIEGDWSWSGIEGNAVLDPFIAGKPGNLNFSARINWLATITGRLGYASDRWLLYVKGGLAVAREKYSAVGFEDTCIGGCIAPFSLSAHETRTGWTIGAGLEHRLWSNWTAKLEYNFIDLGRRTITLAGTFAAPAASPVIDIDQQLHVVKFGVNYRFGQPAARY